MTGLAFSDLRNLTPENMKQAEDGVWWIHTARKKTGTPCHIPLMELPLQLIKKYCGISDQGKLFPMLSCSKTNINLKKIAKLLHGRVEFLGEIPEKIDWIVSLPEYDLALFDNKKNKTDREVAKTLLPEIKAWLEEIDDFSNDNLFTALSEKAKEKGVKSGSVFWIMRIAITGMAVTPGGATEIAELLGKNETFARIDKPLGYLTK